MTKDASGTEKDLKKADESSSKVLRLKKRRVDKKTRYLARLKRRALKHTWLVRIGIIILFFISVYLLVVLISSAIRNTKLGFYTSLARDFIFTPQERVETIAGRTNVLILGKGGQGHEAPDLTDTIIFASVSHKEPYVSLISLSRDIWIPELRAKLNSTYYWGNQKQSGGGLILSKSTVEEIIGQQVHYGVVVDFSGFKNIIDNLSGIEIEVARAFVDERYPIAGREEDDCGGNDPEFLCRYETVEFKKGKQVMDGETALKFARSRNAEGDEGTDFARAARQEKVLEGIRNKVLSREVITNPQKILRVIKVIQGSIETDIDPSAAAILARRIFDARDNVASKVLPEDLLQNPPISPRYDNLYVFIPKTDVNTEPGREWDKVHKWVECVLENGECE